MPFSFFSVFTVTIGNLWIFARRERLFEKYTPFPGNAQFTGVGLFLKSLLFENCHFCPEKWLHLCLFGLLRQTKKDLYHRTAMRSFSSLNAHLMGGFELFLETPLWLLETTF